MPTLNPPRPPSSDIGISYNTFSSSTNLVLNGTASGLDGSLRLVAGGLRSGSAFYNQAIAVDTNTSFRSRFQFRLWDGAGTRNGHGLTFMLQNSPAGTDALGGIAGELGYGSSMTQSLAIEFDTYQDDWDINNNHISILQDGNVNTALASLSSPIDLDSGGLVNAWVEYDGITDQLQVYLSTTTTKPTTALLSYTVDLSSIVGSQAFVGFSAATGDGRNAHDLMNWEFISYSPKPDDVPPVAVLSTPLPVTGGVAYDFTITYSDGYGINAGTIGTGDITVRNTKGFQQTATLIAISSQENGPSVTATYRITAPGGFWNPTDNSTYSVVLNNNQVSDISGNNASGGLLGTFQVGLTNTLKNGNVGAQTLSGDSRHNVLCGLAGNDTLRGLVGNDTLMGGTGNDTLDGGVGTDAASYADATNAVVANLTTGVANRAVRIMPLGDSITFGVRSLSDRGNGGYRRLLAERFAANQINYEFVGSITSRVDGYDNLKHEGHAGATIDWLSSRISGAVSRAQPDVVLLMAGTNDLAHNSDTLQQMLDELTLMINRITAAAPDAYVFVSTVPPVHPDVEDSALITQRLDAYNNALPGWIAGQKATGKKVEFVDMRSLATSYISPPGEDNGLHPTAEGYVQISNFWFNALAGLGIQQGTYNVDRDTLLNIENLTGSAFDDVLIGNAGVNSLEGGVGQDTLTGAGGADIFVYRGIQAAGDIITDFSDNDIFHVSARGFGAGLSSGVTLSEGVSSPTGVLINGNTALGVEATFLYNNRVLSFDSDGTGAADAVVVAQLINGPATLSATHFRITV